MDFSRFDLDIPEIDNLAFRMNNLEVKEEYRRLYDEIKTINDKIMDFKKQIETQEAYLKYLDNIIMGETSFPSIPQEIQDFIDWAKGEKIDVLEKLQTLEQRRQVVTNELNNKKDEFIEINRMKNSVQNLNGA